MSSCLLVFSLHDYHNSSLLRLCLEKYQCLATQRASISGYHKNLLRRWNPCSICWVYPIPCNSGWGWFGKGLSLKQWHVIRHPQDILYVSMNHSSYLPMPRASELFDPLFALEQASAWRAFGPSGSARQGRVRKMWNTMKGNWKKRHVVLIWLKRDFFQPTPDLFSDLVFWSECFSQHLIYVFSFL